MRYTLQVSNHPNAGARVPTAEADRSWRIVYDGPIATAVEARAAVDQLAAFYRHARAFRGASIGRLWYANLRTGPVHRGLSARAVTRHTEGDETP